MVKPKRTVARSKRAVVLITPSRNSTLYTSSTSIYPWSMPSDYDATEFVDGDFEPHQSSHASAPLPRAPTREEVDSKVAAAHQRLAELKREKEEIERERAALEETRRRQIEFQTGRTEMIQNITRGVGLLEEAEFSARRDAEQMAKTLTELRDALAKIEVLNEESWS